MASSFLDVCRFNPTAGGTTDWTYSSAVTGYQSPAAAGAVNGATYRYRAESSDLTQWEIGYGTYNTATNVLSRSTVLFNSAGTGTGAGQTGAGSKISFSAAPQVAVVHLAEDLSPLNTGQIPGSSTNDSANSGNVGELILTSTGASNASAAVTMTIASPCVATWTGHGFTVGPVTTATKFSTTGALPTGVVAGTTYYVKAIDANTFNLATSAANALAGTFVATSGTQSGTHTGDIRVNQANGVSQDVAAIQLSAGDWDVCAEMLKAAGATTSVVYLAGSISTASNNYDRTFGRPLSFQYGGLTIGNAEFTVFDFTPIRFSLTAPTNIYLVGNDSFTTSTMVCSGWMKARRMR